MSSLTGALQALLPSEERSVSSAVRLAGSLLEGTGSVRFKIPVIGVLGPALEVLGLALDKKVLDREL